MYLIWYPYVSGPDAIVGIVQSESQAEYLALLINTRRDGTEAERAEVLQVSDMIEITTV